MSGGSLDYFYYRFEEPIEKIKKEIKWGKNKWSPEVLSEFQNTIKYLKIAHIYSHNVEWLLSGDYGDDSFLEAVKEDLEELKKNQTIIKPQLKKCPLCKDFDGKKCTNRWQQETMDNESSRKRITDASDCYDFEEIDEEGYI
jgi:hypothetical protein